MLLTSLLATCVLSDGLRIQSAKVDLTPPEPLLMGGYTARGTRPFETGGDPLYARVKVLSMRNQRIAIVSCEMLTIPGSLYEAVVKRLPKDTFLFLAATHTHSAPDSQMLNDRMTFSIPGIASFKQRWLDWYSGKIASAIREAERQKGFMTPGLLANRFEERLNRGRRNGAVPDQTATLITAQASKANTPVLFTYSAHATLFGPERLQLSGDWPGEVARRLDCPVVVGAIGDVSPHVAGSTPQEMVHRLAETLVIGAGKSGPQKVVYVYGKAIRTLRTPIELNPVKAHPNMGKFYNAPQVFAESIVGKFAPPSASITAIRLGKLAIIGIPGEPTSHLGRAIKAYGLEQGFTNVLVVSHVNGWMGYILDAGDYDRGGYEATLSFYGRGEGEKVVRAAEKALQALAGK